MRRNSTNKGVCNAVPGVCLGSYGFKTSFGTDEGSLFFSPPSSIWPCCDSQRGNSPYWVLPLMIAVSRAQLSQKVDLGFWVAHRWLWLRALPCSSEAAAARHLSPLREHQRHLNNCTYFTGPSCLLFQSVCHLEAVIIFSCDKIT